MIMKGPRLLAALFFILPLSAIWSITFLYYQSSKKVTESYPHDVDIALHLETFVRVDANNATTSKTAQRSSSATYDDPCFRLNSPEWLRGPRFGNVRDLSFQLHMDSLPLGKSRGESSSSSSNYHHFLQDLLDQSICSDGSRFRSMTEQLDETASYTNATLKAWTTRLIYWSMHYHQTRHARAEAKVRHASGATCHAATATTTATTFIGPYDYECPNATYIVASLADVGLGANVRGGMVYGYLAGLLSNRVVVWVNDSPVGHKFLRRPWALVSCHDDDNTSKSRRQDAQCFFMPSTPCVLTERDIETAYQLSGRETQQLMKLGVQPADHEHDKVWYLKLGFTPVTATPKLAAERLQSYARYLIEEYLLPGLANTETDARQLQSLIYEAADNILRSDEPRKGYNYGAANVKVHHALVVYAMRPRKDKAKHMKELLIDLQTRHAIEPEYSFGLPIRASDKCDRESECLDFEQHMRATRVVWDDFTHSRGASYNLANTSPAIIFTTEARSMAQEQLNFTARHPDFYFRIASNTHDAMPDTGFIANAAATVSADASLLSAVTSLQFQLLARVTLGNCCSNFHTMLADLLAAGCGAASTNDFHCFQEMKDPSLRICCGWFKGCKEEKILAASQWNTG